MENLSIDLKNIIYDYIYGNKKAWIKYYKKNVINEFNEIIEGLIYGILLFNEIFPSSFLNQKMNYENVKEFVENNPKMLLRSIKEYSI